MFLKPGAYDHIAFCAEDLSQWGQVCIHNISSVVEFKRWWVLKSKIFSQESTYFKEKVLKNPYGK